MVQAPVIFKAMADATRQRTLAVLRRHELSVSELVEVLRQPQSTVSRHLRTLRDAGLVRDRRDGTTVLYSVADPGRDGDFGELRGRLLEWVEVQPLADSIATRLGMVIRKRGDMSRHFFDRIGRQWDELREESFGARFHLEAFIALLPHTWEVADIGTGTGYLLPTLAKHFLRVIAVEPVDKMLETARRRLERDKSSNVELYRGDLGQLPIAEASIDLALAVLVLHHVSAPREALAELHRIVRPGGHVLIVEQTAHADGGFRERMQDRWWGFDPGDLARSLESIGFEGVRSHTLATVERANDAPDLFVIAGRNAESAGQEENH